MAIIKLKMPKKANANNCTLSIDKATLLIRAYYADETKLFEQIALTLCEIGWLKPENTKVRNYSRSYSVPEFEDHGKVLISTRPKFAANAPLRLETNPNRLGKSAVNILLKEVCDHFLDGDWKEFSSRVDISRADVAIDLFNLSITQAHFSAPGAKLFQCFHGNGGRKQTEIMKFPGNKRISIYDKASEQKELAQKNKKITLCDIPSVWTRVEANLAKCGRLKNLGNLKNPFLDFSMSQIVKPQDFDDNFWKFFCIAADATSTGAMMASLSAIQRKTLKIHQSKYPIIGWDAKKLWELWPDAVANSGLTDFLQMDPKSLINSHVN